MAQTVRTQEIMPVFYFEGAQKLVSDVFVSQSDITRRHIPLKVWTLHCQKGFYIIIIIIK